MRRIIRSWEIASSPASLCLHRSAISAQRTFICHFALSDQSERSIKCSIERVAQWTKWINQSHNRRNGFSGFAVQSIVRIACLIIMAAAALSLCVLKTMPIDVGVSTKHRYPLFDANFFEMVPFDVDQFAPTTSSNVVRVHLHSRCVSSVRQQTEDFVTWCKQTTKYSNL